jgi:hypothetical protein
MCYADIIESTGSEGSTPQIDPNVTYRTNTPAIPEWDIPAGEDNGQPVLFKTPVEIKADRSAIKVISGEFEIWQGCGTIVPNPCI